MRSILFNGSKICLKIEEVRTKILLNQQGQGIRMPITI